ncbi:MULTISPECIES: SEC-C metal-binding domain-containing protein [unclassified Inquilinus]|uniref:SEC-C metal-binding domain-containing protein n=1 Tax=unclassified Inquilinus TaxID=2645927 RepID=UPI003F9008A9
MSIKRQLRKEVGFGCPIPGCGSPYLEWHHFDPPWHVKNHHDAAGMIALCRNHHAKADAGSWTMEQLRRYKQDVVEAGRVKGKFDWQRYNVLAIIGGCVAYQNSSILKIDGMEVIKFVRDSEGYFSLNLQMLSLASEERAIIEENFWSNIGEPADVRSPTNGKELEIKYHNGDYFRVKFVELMDANEAVKMYKNKALVDESVIKYPLLAVEIDYKVAGSLVDINPRGMNLEGSRYVNFFSAFSGGAAFSTTTNGLKFRQNPSRYAWDLTSRNSECLCGSGLRFKHCHGMLV